MLALILAIIVPVQGDALICFFISLAASLAVEAVRAVDSLRQGGLFQHWDGEFVLIAIVAKKNLASTSGALMPLQICLDRSAVAGAMLYRLGVLFAG